MISECKKAARIAEEEGVILCMECHQKSFTNVLEGALDLMRSVNSPAFRMYWQPSTTAPVEDNIKYARGIKDYVDTIHVFYYKDGKKAYLKDGAEEWKRYLSEFENDKKLLLEFMPDGSPDSLKGEAAALTAIAAEFN